MSDKPTESGIPNLVNSDGGKRTLTEDSYTQRQSMKAFHQSGRYIGANEGYGAQISDENRYFYSTREPVGIWWVKDIAYDIWDNWFKVIDVADVDSEALDDKVQRVLTQLKAKTQLPRETIFERRYGTSILLCSYTGFGEENSWESTLFELNSDGSPPETIESNKQLLQITPYPWTKVNVDELDKNKSSIRYGMPEFYNIEAGQGKQSAAPSFGSEEDINLKVHWTRAIHSAPRLDEHTYEGMPALDGIFDDLIGGRNARWGAYESYYRHGTGFPVIKTKGTHEQNQAWIEAGGLTDTLNVQGYFVCHVDESFEFIGAKGQALNPNDYFDMYYGFISTGTGIAKDTIQGVSSGRVTGGEFNDRKKVKAISIHQNLKTPMLRELIDRIIQTGQVEFTGEYKVEWIDPSSVNPQDKASIEFLQERTNALRLQTETIDEVRARKGMDALPDGKGENLMPQPGQTPTTGGAANQEEPTRQATEPEQPDGDDDDSLFKRIKAMLPSL